MNFRTTRPSASA